MKEIITDIQNIALTTGGAFLFSTGLSSRIVTDNFPDLINGDINRDPIIPGLKGKNGTIPGLILSGPILLASIIPINNKNVKNIQKIIKPFALGGWTFAVGASNLSNMSRK